MFIIDGHNLLHSICQTGDDSRAISYVQSGLIAGGKYFTV